MKNKLWPVLFVIFGLYILSVPIFAHHSDSVYDMEHYITVKGTVTQFDFVNPHVLIRMDVKTGKGSVEEWVTFGSPPNRMVRAGWNSKTIKNGEELTVTGFQFKDSRKIMLFQKIVRSNGEELPEPETLTNFSTRQGKAPK